MCLIVDIRRLSAPRILAAGLAMTAIAAAANAQDVKSNGKNVIGRDLSREAPAGMPGVPTLDAFRRVPEMPGIQLPTFQPRVILSPESTISAPVRSLILPGTTLPQRTGSTLEAFPIDNLDLETVKRALLADEVVRVELHRPLRVPLPTDRVPFNEDARRTHAVSLFESNLHRGQGASIVAALIDGGAVRSTHVEFQDKRVTLREQDTRMSAHATHVAGTMGATGLRAGARGMAPKLRILSYSFEGDDIAKLASVAGEVQVSNHSYGPLTGWSRQGNRWVWYGDASVDPTEDADFGKYGTDCERIDALLAQFPRLTSIAAAGNDRDDGPVNQPVEHLIGSVDSRTQAFSWTVSSDVRKRDGHKAGGIDTLSGLAVCKNVVTVGAINDLYSDGKLVGSARIESTTFSSWGPTDDGRIKPDVVANGQTLLSPTIQTVGGGATPDSLYEDMSGTSMAAPTVSGIVSILAEYFEAMKRRKPESAEMKALLIHSATDAGAPGPDPQYGYGSVNALGAGEMVQGDDGERVETIEIVAGETKNLKFQSTGKPVRVTIAWIDPPARANTAGLNDPTPTLTHDVDLELMDPDGTRHFPYRIDLSDAHQPARNDGPNRVDNAERVDAPASPGLWTVILRGASMPSGSSQRVAIVISGLRI